MSIKDNFPIVSPSLSLDFANTKALDPRITFSRPTSAVYYDGKTVSLAEQNLLTYSQEFDTGWDIYSVTISANSITAPDGTSTADSLINDGANAFHGVGKAIASNSEPKTFSSFFKANQITNVSIAIGNSSVATFDLTAGTVSKTAGVDYVSSSITALADGWYRCSLTSTASVGFAFFWLNSTNNPTYGAAYGYEVFTGTAGDLVYIWGAQLEQRSSVTAYQPTTTQPITNYIPTLLTAPANTARFDHNPVTGESLGLLVEEQRTNLFTYSEQFDNAVWGKTGATVTANQAVAPDGTLTGDKLIENTATSGHYLVRPVAINGVYTLSVFAKAGEETFLNIWSDSNFSGIAYFDLINGTVVATTGTQLASASITQVGNGWYRCSITTPSLNKTAYFVIGMGNPLSYTGDGYSGIYLWGAQLEAGAFPTSYVKTVASQVTRSADSASMTGTNFSDWYNPSQSTVYCESSTNGPNSAAVAYSPYSLNSGSAINAIFTQYYNGAVNSIVRSVYDGEAARMNSLPVVPNTFYKTVLACAKNDFATSTSGASVATDNTGTMPSNMNVLNIGISYSNQQPLNGYIKKLSYYPARLTNTQLQAITS